MVDTKNNLITSFENAQDDIIKQYEPYVKEYIFDRGALKKYLTETETKLFGAYETKTNLKIEDHDTTEIDNMIEILQKLREELLTGIQTLDDNFKELEESRDEELKETSKITKTNLLAKTPKNNLFAKLFAVLFKKVKGVEKFKDYVIKPAKAKVERILFEQLPKVAKQNEERAKKQNAIVLALEERSIATLQDISNKARELQEQYKNLVSEDFVRSAGKYYVKGMEIASESMTNGINPLAVGGTIVKINTKTIREIIDDVDENVGTALIHDKGESNRQIENELEGMTNLAFEH
jgi:hypothetical protein